jgi:hypothetical protein
MKRNAIPGMVAGSLFCEQRFSGVVMSATSKARRSAHRALGRNVKEGKADEAAAAAYKVVEDKRTAKLKKK